MGTRFRLTHLLVTGLLAIAVGLAGCSGDKGDTGPRGHQGEPGIPGTSVGTISGTVMMANGGPLAGIQVMANPSTLTAADGSFTLPDVAIGTYTLTINGSTGNPSYNSNFATTTQSVSVKAGETTSLGTVKLTASSPFLVSGTTAAPGETATLTFSSVDGSAVTGVTLTQTSGIAVTPAAGATPNVMTVPMPTLEAFKDRYFNILATERGEVEADTGGTGTGENAEEPEHAGVLLDRYMVMGINAYDLEETTAIALTAEVTTENGTYTGEVDMTGDLPFKLFTTGLETVPVGQPVLLHGKTAASYSWSFGSKPAGATASSDLVDADTQNPHFTPDAVGSYVINDGGSKVLTVYAGLWRGVIDPAATAANGGKIVADSSCTTCHGGALAFAPDKFTPWSTSGHAEIFTDNINAGGHYSPSCFECHTVGYESGGMGSQADYEAFLEDLFPESNHGAPLANPGNWMKVLTTYPDVAKLANIQCENCHGPQDSTGDHMSSGATGNVGPRVSLSSDVCGSCHGEPARHGRFQQWQESGHGDFTVAVGEGVNEPEDPSTVGIGVRTTCGGCHSAQGALVWFRQLQSGRPTAASRTLDATSLADKSLSSSGTLNDMVTTDNVQPQTCAVCHDPHAEGNLSGVPNTATVRIDNNTPMLPAGFAATGVGRGAMCITCHNSRNGELVRGSGVTGLHEDGDPLFGTLTSFSEPHRSAQGDVLMGRNAYFVSGVRSPHSFLQDTCTTCHMEKTPPPADLSYQLGGTNHTFLASPTICTNCHTDASATGLQEAVEEGLADLSDAMAKAAVRLAVADVADNPGLVAPDYAAGDTATFSLSHSGLSVTITYASDGSTASPTIPFNDTLAKAAWNHSLIELDASGGVHNPEFAFDVIDASISRVNGITATM